jgi:hypothetical protein
VAIGWRSAISSIDLIPGSNPLFGLNTLGGALAVRTKSGFAFQGTEVEASGGSFGRWAVEAEHGGYRDKVDWYLTFMPWMKRAGAWNRHHGSVSSSASSAERRTSRIWVGVKLRF